MQKNSLFRRLLITLTLTGAAICLIFMGTVFAGGTISNLKDISYHLFHQRVIFRVSDLQEIMATDLYQQDTYKELLHVKRFIILLPPIRTAGSCRHPS